MTLHHAHYDMCAPPLPAGLMSVSCSLLNPMEVLQATITPDTARRLLERNSVNRPVKPWHVRDLARDIKDGRWKLNGSTIVVNDHRLIDGQHRLLAVLQANLPIETLVVTGISSDVFDTIDIGAKRSGADTLAVNGESYAAALSASLVVVNDYKLGCVGAKRKYANSEINELLTRYPGLRDSVAKVCSKNKFRKVLYLSIGSALHYLFSETDPELADQFMDRICYGENLSKSDPEFVLRDRLQQNMISKAKFPKEYIMAICIKAWNARRTGKSIRALVWKDGEPFPVIL